MTGYQAPAPSRAGVTSPAWHSRRWPFLIPLGTWNRRGRGDGGRSARDTEQDPDLIRSLASCAASWWVWCSPTWCCPEARSAPTSRAHHAHQAVRAAGACRWPFPHPDPGTRGAGMRVSRSVGTGT